MSDSPARAVREWLSFAFVLTVLAAGFLSTSALAALLTLILPRRHRKPFGRALIRRGFQFAVATMRVTGLCTVDLAALAPLHHARGMVIAPNHPALLDVVLIVACLPNAVCILKAGLWNNPLLGGTARLAGYIRNDSPLLLVRAATAELEAGANLLVFPEGTRTPPGQRLGPFKPGFVAMARAARAPIQTVFLRADTAYLGKGWPVWRKPRLPMAFHARLGPVVTVDAPTRPFLAQLEATMRAAL